MKLHSKYLFVYILFTYLSCNLFKFEDVEKAIKHEKIITFDKNNSYIELNFYYVKDTLFLIEKKLDTEQTIDIDPVNEKLFNKYYFDNSNKKLIGVGEFTYYCSKCHSSYPEARDLIVSKGYDDRDSLYNLLRFTDHGKIDEDFSKVFNRYEIEAMLSYINRIKK